MKSLNKPLFAQIQQDEVVIPNTEEKSEPASQDIVPTVSSTEDVQTEEQPTESTTATDELQAEQIEGVPIPETDKVNDENENPFAL